jgi:hypothetical protein
MTEKLEHISYINEYGIGLDDYGNEYRDEDGMIYLVPIELRQNFKILNQGEEYWAIVAK